MFVKII